MNQNENSYSEIFKNKRIIELNENLNIPLFGLDFIGIIDRGTNLLEIKPINLCNLQCKYCFVKCGSYNYNFTINHNYLIDWLKKVIDIKPTNDIEIHIAPYGEFFLYPQFLDLIKLIRSLSKVKIISIQTNGILLNENLIKEIEKAGCSRLNISFNSLDENLAKFLSNNPNYSVSKILNIFDKVLRSKMELLIAPIWFFGLNDIEIIKIIELVKNYEKYDFKWPKLRLGIQNYLIYKTGRKLKKIKQRDFSYFYYRLQILEKKFNIKLKLGPLDFGIHPSVPIKPPLEYNQKINVSVVLPGRFKNEYIGKYNDLWAVKIISNHPLKIGSVISGVIIKSKTNENLITIKT